MGLPHFRDIGHFLSFVPYIHISTELSTDYVFQEASAFIIASEAKNGFGKLIDAAQRHPVAINRRGRRVAFVISPADMEAMEDHYLGMRAMEAMRNGKFLGVKKSEAFLKSLLHARD